MISIEAWTVHMHIHYFFIKSVCLQIITFSKNNTSYCLPTFSVLSIVFTGHCKGVDVPFPLDSSTFFHGFHNLAMYGWMYL